MGTAFSQLAATGKLFAVGLLLTGLYLYARPAPSAAKWEQLNAAITESDFQAVQQLLDAGADVNAGDEIGETPLHRAACRGNTQAVEMLLGRDARRDAQDANGQTPLSAAAATGKLEALRALLAAGATTRSHDRFGRTPLHWAAAAGCAAAVSDLLSHGADPQITDGNGQTPRMIAESMARVEVLAVLDARTHRNGPRALALAVVE